MAKKVKTQTQVRKKKKIWMPINAPKIFGEMKIGETNVFLKDDAIGKTVSINMMNLTGDMRKQNITAKLLVNKVLNNAGQTRLIEYKMAASFLKRFIRRRRDKLDISEVFTTKDDKKVRIKPLLITTTTTRGSTQTALRNKLKSMIESKVKEITYETFIKDVVSYKFQNYLKADLKKIHPLRNCEIRAFKLVNKADAENIVDEISDESSESIEIEAKEPKKTSKAKTESKEESEEPEAEEAKTEKESEPKEDSEETEEKESEEKPAKKEEKAAESDDKTESKEDSEESEDKETDKKKE